MLAGVYAILFLIHLRSIVDSVYLSADVVSAPYLGELAGRAPPGAHILLGNIAWFPALWFELVTHWLPAHRQIWELAPYVLSLAGVGLVAWSALKAGGRWPATMTALVLAAASPGLLGYQFGWSIHALAYVEVAILGAFHVLCVTHHGRIGSRPAHASLVGLVGTITAVGLACDLLVALAGLAPFLLAALATLPLQPRQAGRRIVATAGGVAVVAVLGALLLHQLVSDAGISSAPFPITLAGYNQLAPHLVLALQSVAYLFYGDFGGLALSITSALKLVCAAVVAAAVFGGLVAARDQMRPILTGGAVGDDLSSGSRSAHLAFWSLVVCVTGLGYVLSSVPVNQYTSRYLVPAAYGLAAVLTVLATRGGRLRIAVVSGVSVLTLAGAVSLARHDLQANPSRFPTASLSGPLWQFARSEGLTYGYSGYWDAAPLTWQTKTAINVYPVRPCGATLCPFYFHQISSWYTARPGIRTFLVSDPTQPGNPLAPSALGKPMRSVRIGRLTVYVYAYDIASKFGA
ncbi:MAG: hypothetical protein WCB67_04750 [Solirubrobacteraceae bacterium]